MSTMADSDTVLAEQRLVRRAQAGDAQSRRELIDLFKDRLYVFVLRMVRNHHDAEEICQEAFLKAFAALADYSTQYRFSTWLFTIAYRVCLNSLRRRRITIRPDHPGLPEEPADPDDTDMLESDDARRVKDEVWRCVDQLTPPQRASVLLFYRQNYSCDEIGQILQVPVATVKSHLHRARAKLRDLLSTGISAFSAEDRNFRSQVG